MFVPQRQSWREVNQTSTRKWLEVSFPMWEDDIKDAPDAIQRYGKLYTLKSIIDARISNNTKISVKMRIDKIKHEKR